jgi:hypothetical protein
VVSTQGVFFSFTQTVDVHSCLQTWHKFYPSWFQKHQKTSESVSKVWGNNSRFNCSETYRISTWLIQYCDLLQARWPGVQTPVGGEIFSTQPDQPTQRPVLWVLGLFPRSTVAGVWHWTFWCLSRVMEQLHLPSPSVPARHRTEQPFTYPPRINTWVLFLKLPDVSHCSY